MSIPAEQIPLWFWIIAIIGLFGAVVALFKFILSRNKDDWNEVREGLKTLTGNVNDLIKIQTLHTHQINENTSDIKDLQSRLADAPIVKYEKV